MIPDLDLSPYFLATLATTHRPEPDPPSEIDPVLPAELFIEPRPLALGRAQSALRSASSPPSSKPLRPGTMIDKYRLGEVVGTGGFAVVYRARHLLLDKVVAIKLLKPEVIAERPGIAALLVEEARLAARIDHPNVLHVLDVTCSKELAYIVMEFIDGISLSRRLATGGALAPAEVLRIGLDVAAGLRAGHEQGLVHRDIKPANILLAKNGTARIVDYGMAHPFGSEDWLSARSRRSVVGTRGYMAPEQAAGGDVDFRADIYALGITLEEALRGARDSIMGSALRPSIPPQVSALLDWMQAPEPYRRPTSFDALIAKLAEAERALSPAIAHRG